MTPVEDKNKDLANLSCPECNSGWLVRDWEKNMVCQNCGAKFDMEELLKKIRKEGL
ncbi:MAG: hypothetical protein V5A88_09475 [Candidatus Thermoplasmatota archaeon]